MRALLAIVTGLTFIAAPVTASAGPVFPGSRCGPIDVMMLPDQPAAKAAVCPFLFLGGAVGAAAAAPLAALASPWPRDSESDGGMAQRFRDDVLTGAGVGAFLLATPPMLATVSVYVAVTGRLPD